MKLFNLFVGRLVKSNLAFTEADASQIKSFIEAILFFCEGKTNGTRIGGMILLVILLSKSSGSTVHVAWPLVWFDRLWKKNTAEPLRKKVSRNFRGTSLKNRFRRLKLYSNPPTWLARSLTKEKDWSSHFWQCQPFRFWYVEVHHQRRLKSTKTGIFS